MRGAPGGVRGRLAVYAAGLSHVWVAAVLLLAPRLAEACSVCFAGRDDETRAAFLLTTLFLSALPPAIVGGVAYWLVRRARALEAQRQAEEAEPRPRPVGAAARV